MYMSAEGMKSGTLFEYNSLSSIVHLSYLCAPATPMQHAAHSMQHATYNLPHATHVVRLQPCWSEQSQAGCVPRGLMRFDWHCTSVVLAAAVAAERAVRGERVQDSRSRRDARVWCRSARREPAARLGRKSCVYTRNPTRMLASHAGIQTLSKQCRGFGL